MKRKRSLAVLVVALCAGITSSSSHWRCGFPSSSLEDVNAQRVECWVASCTRPSACWDDIGDAVQAAVEVGGAEDTDVEVSLHITASINKTICDVTWDLFQSDWVQDKLVGLEFQVDGSSQVALSQFVADEESDATCGILPRVSRVYFSGAGMHGHLTDLLTALDINLLVELHVADAPLVHVDIAALDSFQVLQKLAIQRIGLVANLSSVADLSALTTLEISSEAFEADGEPVQFPDRWEPLGSTLTELKLESSAFRGTLPESLATLTNLTSLSINAPGLIPQPIPTFLEELSNLQVLRLAETNRNGTIPFFLAELRNLVLLDLSFNSLTGTVPESVSINALRSLDLENNQLTGTLYLPESSTMPFLVNINANSFTAIHLEPLVGHAPLLELPSLAALADTSPGLFLDTTSLTCSCRTLSSVWRLSQQYADSFFGEGSSCLHQTSTSTAQLQLPIAKYAGGPCVDNGPAAVLLHAQYEEDNRLTLVWSSTLSANIDTSSSSFSTSSEETAFLQSFDSRYGNCQGCIRLATDLHQLNPADFSTRFAFLVRFQESAAPDRSCCAVTLSSPMRPSLNMSYTFLSKDVNITRGYVSVTMARIAPNTVVSSAPLSLMLDFKADTRPVQRPAPFSITSQDTGQLVLQYTYSTEQSRVTFTQHKGVQSTGQEYLVVEIVNTRSGTVMDSTTLPRGETSFDLSDRLNALTLDVSPPPTIQVRVVDQRTFESRFSEDVTLYAKPVLRSCPAGKGAQVNGTESNFVSGKSQQDATPSQENCVICPQGTFSTGEMVVCHACPTGQTTLEAGSISPKNCSVADVGYLKDCLFDSENGLDNSGSSQDCFRKCRSEMDCSRKGTTLENLILNPGYWRPSDLSLEIFNCPQQSFCKPDRFSNTSSGRLCSPFHTGLVCNKCVPGYGLSERSCEKCTSEVVDEQQVKAGLVLAFLCVVLTLPFVRLLLHSRGGFRSLLKAGKKRFCSASTFCSSQEAQQNSSGPVQDMSSSMKQEQDPEQQERTQVPKVRKTRRGMVVYFEKCVWNKLFILVGFFQIYICYARFFDVHGLPLRGLLTAFAFQFSCLTSEHQYIFLSMWTIIPVALLAALLSAMILYKRTSRSPSARIFVEAWTAVLFVSWIAYPLSTAAILSIFPCNKIGHTSYVLADLKTICSGPKYTWWMSYAIFMCILICVGTPVFYAAILFRKRKTFIKEKWSEHDAQEVRKYWFLYFPYTNKAYWFEAYDTLRKFIQVGGVIFLMPSIAPITSPGETDFEQDFSSRFQTSLGQNFPQVTFSLVATLSALFMLQIIQPYRNRFDSAYASISMANLCAVCISVVVLTDKDEQIDTGESEWVIVAILIIECVVAVGLCLYDICHLGQYPDREDEMRVKIKRNFYHSAIPNTEPEADEPHVHFSSSFRELPLTLDPSPPSLTDLHSDRYHQAFAMTHVSHSPEDTGYEADRVEDSSSQMGSLPSIAPMSLRFMSGSPKRPPRIDQIQFGPIEDEESEKESYEQVHQTTVRQRNTHVPGGHPSGEAIVIHGVRIPGSGYKERGEFLRKNDVLKFSALGLGGSSSVSVALDRESFRLVAVKEVSIHDVSNSRQAIQELLALEANGSLIPRAGKKACEQIIGLYNCFFDARTENLWLVTEFMDGGTLQDVIDSHRRNAGESVKETVADHAPFLFGRKKTPLESPQCKENAQGEFPHVWASVSASKCDEVAICNEAMLARVAADMLVALVFLHSNGYVHLDIKPSNVFINSEGHAKLADFGLSQRLSAYQASQGGAKFVGTIKYMSPERLRGNPASYASDIWSFGLTLLACTLGHYPVQFQGTSKDTRGEQRDLYWLLLDRLDRNRQALELPEFAATRPLGPGSKKLVSFSADFRQFISRALDLHENNRASAKELLEHPWLKKFQHSSPPSTPPAQVLEPSQFDASCVALDKISSALMVGVARGRPRAGTAFSVSTPMGTPGFLRSPAPIVASVEICEQQIESLASHLSLAKEIVKYSLLVSGDAARVKVTFV